MIGNKNSRPETITALATPSGKSGVGVVRVSGPKAYEIAKAILETDQLKARHAYYLPFYDEEKLLDHGIAIYFKAPYSFTGEDVLELQGHGGPIVLDQILKTTIKLGARLANPGEFSERAFLNGKMDLTQVEAIADLINASSEEAVRSAVASLQGEFSNAIHQLVDHITQLRVYVEAAIDFPEEEIDFLSDGKVGASLIEIIDQLKIVKAKAKQGAILREGMTVVIAGKPNVGKSSLLNALAERESAIVTEIAGTTRDLLREYIHIDGMPLHIIDTAGLRETEDQVEREGVKRAWAAIETADKVLFVIDEKEKEHDPKKLWPEFFEKFHTIKPFVVIKNKIDISNEKAHIEKREHYSIVYLSAKEKKGLAELKNYLKEYMGYHQHTEGVFIARRRHLDAISRAHEFLLEAETQLQENQAGELVAEELRQAQQALSEITGEFTTDDLLGEIFSNFCIGK